LEVATATTGKSVKKKDHVSAFIAAVSQFSTPAFTDQALAQIPTNLVSHFEAERSELWLFEDSTNSAYLTHAAGQTATHRRDFVERGTGAVGKAVLLRKGAHNAALSSFGPDDAEFAKLTGLSQVSTFPMIVAEKLVGVVVNYTNGPVADDLITWWQVYSEICAIRVRDALAAKENQKVITQLSLLFEATRLLNSTLDLAELLELILKIARNELNADRGSVFLVDQKQRQIWSIVASGLGGQEIRVPFGSGVAGRVAETGESINVEDAYTLEFFNRSFDQKTGYRTKSLLCLPIRHHSGEIVGVIQLLNQTNSGRFSKEDEDFLLKLSGHMAMALENARLHRESLEKQRLEKELALARTIQRSLLPDAPPVVPGYELAVLNEPCFEVGGDYYDFLTLGPQTLLLVIADVEGKGVSSALVMSNLQATLRALVMHLHSLEVLTLSLNEMIYNDTKSEKYLSIFLGLVDTRRGGLHYINAGHVPPILVRAENGEYSRLEEGGMVVGLFPVAEYERGSTRLKPGDVLVLCTDGIGEACDTQEEEYGMDRLAQCVARYRDRSAQEICDEILKEVTVFAKGGVHVDDKVLMILKVSPDFKFTTARAKA